VRTHHRRRNSATADGESTLIVPSMEPIWVVNETGTGEVMWELALEVPGGVFILETHLTLALCHENLLRLPTDKVTTTLKRLSVTIRGVTGPDTNGPFIGEGP
jgi:hypothetical protein